MHSPIFGEFMGTMVLILLGDGVVANVLLKKSKGEGSGWIVITTGWGLAVMAGIFTAIACGSSAAHINPAVTLAVALLTGKWAMVLPFWAAQFAGAFVGATLTWLVYSASLVGNRRSGSEAGHLLHRPGYPQSSRELPDRSHRDHHADLRRFRVWRLGRFSDRVTSWLRSLSVGHAGLGARSLPRRSDRICHEPCS